MYVIFTLKEERYIMEKIEQIARTIGATLFPGTLAYLLYLLYTTGI